MKLFHFSYFQIVKLEDYTYVRFFSILASVLSRHEMYVYIDLKAMTDLSIKAMVTSNEWQACWHLLGAGGILLFSANLEQTIPFPM